ncbi:unnamed protein product [Closterium sp. Naga37s-1]|nr:unnamed protein product [Closterium sp. Naga37s-1]
MIVVHGFQRVLADWDHSSANRLTVVRAAKTKSLKSMRDNIVKHAGELAVDIVLTEPAVGRTSGARATAAHAPPPADSAADTETATEVAGDSSAGANREVGAAEKGKDRSAGTVGKALAIDYRGSDDVGKGPRKSGNRSFEELSVLPHLTLVHEVMRLEADARRAKDMAKTQERQLAQQREKLSELMGWIAENQEAFERGMLTMSRIEARLDESDKRGHRDVADAVQEIRVERVNAMSQRETSALALVRVEATALDLKTLVTFAINDVAERTRTEVWRKLVGLEDSVARAAERGAGAGAMILRTVMGNIGRNAGSTADPVHSAGRDPKLGAGAAGDASLPLMLAGGGEPVRHDKRSVPQVAEGEASNRAKKVKSAGGITSAGPKEAAPGVAASKDVVVASSRLAIGTKGTNEGAEDSVGDEEDKAREAWRKYLAARAAAKGAGPGAEVGNPKSAEIVQTPMVGVRFNPGQKNPFWVELHHGGERFYLGSFSRAGSARYQYAVASTIWHDRVQKSELVLTDLKEEEWTLGLDLARKMTAVS